MGGANARRRDDTATATVRNVQAAGTRASGQWLPGAKFFRES
jgi:hypothetical protein